MVCPLSYGKHIHKKGSLSTWALHLVGGRGGGVKIYFGNAQIDLLLSLYRVIFLTVPPDFRYQNEKQVAANKDSFFKKVSM